MNQGNGSLRKDFSDRAECIPRYPDFWVTVRGLGEYPQVDFRGSKFPLGTQKNDLLEF